MTTREPRTLQLLTYTYVEGMAERRAPHRPAHLALIEEYVADGRLVVAGAVGAPPSTGLLAFATVEAAESFAAADPFGTAGLVVSWSIQPWVVVVGL